MPLTKEDHLPYIPDSNAPRNEVVPIRIRTRNRRKRYLDLHPEYFGSELELADPLLYDRLIRRFQSTTEREVEGRNKGYSGVLEADLARSEAKLDALRNPDPNNSLTYRRGRDGEILAEEGADIPVSKEEGFARWNDIMKQRFLNGHDKDFDYKTVDDNDEYDDKALENREAEDEYFDQQTPEFVEDDSERTGKLEGETGVQDF